MIRIRLLTGIPGSGKTRHVVNEMTTSPAKYLFATTRTDLIEERCRDINTAGASSGTRPAIERVYSGMGFPVASEIRSLAAKHADTQHVIALITHEGLMLADLSQFAGWHLVIDEVPAAIASNTMNIAGAAEHLALNYHLEPSTDEWSRVHPRPTAPLPSSLLHDDVLVLSAFDKRARSRHGLYVDTTDFASFKDSKKRLRWWSAWTPIEMRAFESVTIAAAGFENSIAFKVYQAGFSDEVTYEFVRLPSPPRARQKIEIAYFTAGHRSSTGYWSKPEGRKALSQAAAYLGSLPEIGFMATNNPTTGFFNNLSAPQLSPRLEGTNSLIDRTSCAFLYSAKAVPADMPIRQIFGLKKSDIVRAREFEDIAQFVFRGAIRDPNWSGTYRIYLYDRTQAEALRDYIRQHDIAEIGLIAIEEAGIMDVTRPKPGPEPKLTPQQKAAKKKALDEAYRAKKKAEKVAAGIPIKPRGRPRRMAA